MLNVNNIPMGSLGGSNLYRSTGTNVTGFPVKEMLSVVEEINGVFSPTGLIITGNNLAELGQSTVRPMFIVTVLNPAMSGEKNTIIIPFVFGEPNMQELTVNENNAQYTVSAVSSMVFDNTVYKFLLEYYGGKVFFAPVVQMESTTDENRSSIMEQFRRCVHFTILGNSGLIGVYIENDNKPISGGNLNINYLDTTLKEVGSGHIVANVAKLTLSPNDNGGQNPFNLNGPYGSVPILIDGMQLDVVPTSMAKPNLKIGQYPASVYTLVIRHNVTGSNYGDSFATHVLAAALTQGCQTGTILMQVMSGNPDNKERTLSSRPEMLLADVGNPSSAADGNPFGFFMNQVSELPTINNISDALSLIFAGLCNPNTMDIANVTTSHELRVSTMSGPQLLALLLSAGISQHGAVDNVTKAKAHELVTRQLEESFGIKLPAEIKSQPYVEMARLALTGYYSDTTGNRQPIDAIPYTLYRAAAAARGPAVISAVKGYYYGLVDNRSLLPTKNMAALGEIVTQMTEGGAVFQGYQPLLRINPALINYIVANVINASQINYAGNGVQNGWTGYMTWNNAWSGGKSYS